MKDRVIESAKKEINKRGFRFTMRDLAKKLGISTKTLYGVYSSKDDLLDDILKLAMDEIQTKEKEILSNAKLDSIRKLRALLVLLPSDFYITDLRRLEELQRFYPKLWEKLDHFINDQWEGVTFLINEAMETGKLRSFNMRLFIDLYIGGFYRLMDPALQNDKITLKDALEEIVDILLLGIIKDPR